MLEHPCVDFSGCMDVSAFRVEFKDERLTTTDAKARLFEHGGYKALGKSRVDAVSAQLILESWMESHYGALTETMIQNSWL